MIESQLGHCIAAVRRDPEQPMNNRRKAKEMADEWVRETRGITYCEVNHRMLRAEEVMSQRAPQFVERLPTECAGILAPLSPRAAERRHPRLFRKKSYRHFTINVTGDVEDGADLKPRRPNLDAKLRKHEMARRRRR